MAKNARLDAVSIQTSTNTYIKYWLYRYCHLSFQPQSGAPKCSVVLVKSEEEKENYYANVVADLKTSNISPWYSKVKRMSGQTNSMSEVTVDELIGLSDQNQAEKITDHYASVSQLYEPVKHKTTWNIVSPQSFPHPGSQPLR